jgi:hypothetical protein
MVSMSECNDLLGHLLELQLLILSDVVLLVLGGGKNEDCLIALAVEQDAAVALGLAPSERGIRCFIT